MRMIKKICSVICAAVIALGGVNIVVIRTGYRITNQI